MMLSTILRFSAILFLTVDTASAQGDVDQCALDCIANVNGTSCSQAQWSCLCADRAYIERVNTCTYQSCNKTEQDTTFAAVNQICRVFSQTITYGPEATAPTSSDQIFSTQGIQSLTSLSPVSTSSVTSTPSTTNGFSNATPSPSRSSASAATTASAASSTSSASGTAASTGNLAGKVGWDGVVIVLAGIGQCLLG